MRALLFDGTLGYTTELPEPSPQAGEALVRVNLAGICATDLEITRGYMSFKGILGHEFVGTVVSAEDPALVGKRVVGEINSGCGRCQWCLKGRKEHCPDRRVLGIYRKDGAFADYLTLPAENLHPVPEGLKDEEAVFTEPVAAALEILEQCHIRPTSRVCVVGDGRLGLIVAQALRLTGCALTVVGKHREKLRILEDMGIETCLLEKSRHLCGFHVVVDVTGSPEGIEFSSSILAPEGTLVVKTTVKDAGGIGLNRIVVDELKIVGSRCGPFEPALRLLSHGLVRVKPLISAVFPIEKGVDALREAEKKGVLKVLIKMD